MSIESVARVLPLAGLGPSHKLLLIGIANHDGDGGAWPKIATLATYLDCSERQVQRLLVELVERGYLTVARNAGGTRHTRGDRRPNRYLLHVPPVDNQGHGVTSGSPRDPHGVTFGAARGDILSGVSRSRGDIAMSPEPSFEPSPLNRPRARTRTDSRLSTGPALMSDLFMRVVDP